MSAGEIHINDIGTQFDITIKDQDSAVVDVSSATVKEFIFKKPDDTLLTKSAEFITDGTDGKVRYISEVGDLDQTGYWKLQVRITMPSGVHNSDIYQFGVYANL